MANILLMYVMIRTKHSDSEYKNMNDVELEKMFKALANKRRLKILGILKNKPIPVSDLAKAIKLSFRSTSKHLAILHSAGFLDREQIGFVTLYKIVSDRFKILFRSSKFA